MVEAGFTRAKNACNIMMKNLMDFSMGTLGFWGVILVILLVSAGVLAAGAAQAQSAQSQNALEVREQHLDLLAVAAGGLECGRVVECPGDVTGVFVAMAKDLSGRLRSGNSAP